MNLQKLDFTLKVLRTFSKSRIGFLSGEPDRSSAPGSCQWDFRCMLERQFSQNMPQNWTTDLIWHSPHWTRTSRRSLCWKPGLSSSAWWTSRTAGFACCKVQFSKLQWKLCCTWRRRGSASDRSKSRSCRPGCPARRRSSSGQMDSWEKSQMLCLLY